VNWNLLYENVTPTNDPIAVFKKTDEEKFFLEDPKNLLDRGDCPTIDFSTATWGKVFGYSIYMRYSLRDDQFNRLFSKNATEFMKALAISAAQNCPIDFKVWRYSDPLRFAVYKDIDIVSILLQRGAVIEPDALEKAIVDFNLEMVRILLENGADVRAEIDCYEVRPKPIYEYCAQRLQRLEGYGCYSLENLEKMREINKLVMDQKEKTII